MDCKQKKIHDAPALAALFPGAMSIHTTLAKTSLPYHGWLTIFLMLQTLFKKYKKQLQHGLMVKEEKV